MPTARRWKADPQDASAWSNLGVLLDDQGRKEEAEDAYRQALEADPQDAQAWYNLGTLLRTSHLFDEARAALEQAILYASGKATYHARLGEVYKRLGRQEEAT